MTAPESALLDLRAMLQTVEGECPCGAIPHVKYEPGVLMILCWKCRERGLNPHGVCVPDFDPQAVWEKWINLFWNNPEITL